jgi:hydantoinase/carbamoylase family amidase
VSEILDDLEAVARFGGEGTGVTRFSWTDELDQAYEYVAARLGELGLDIEIDVVGNLIARWHAGGGKPVVLGSHLDSVLKGGRFDGTLGVLAGLHAIRLLKERGVEPARPVWLVSFMDEDGGRFGGGMLGSRAFVGDDVSAMADRADRDGVTVREAMAAKGFDFERIPEARGVEEIGLYLELHIEQGPVLEQRGVEIGVVTQIVGTLAFRARLLGEANHAGTTPMPLRRDALAGAARVALRLREYAREHAGTTANVGSVRVEPGAFNIVPGLAEFTIDIRSATEEGFAALEPAVRATLDEIAAEEQLDVELEELHRLRPCPMAGELVETIERAAELEGASHMRMPSGAGHDAMQIGRYVPAAMIFVPSRRGISHNPDEYTSPEHCELGARVLARSLELLVGGA